MICPNCNSPLPDGGFFCPECGMRIPQTAAAVAAAAVMEEPTRPVPVPAPQSEPEIPATPVYTQPEPPVYNPPVYTPPVPPVYNPPSYEAPVATEPAKPKKEKKKKEKKASSGKAGKVILTVVLVVLLLAAVALNVWQYLRYEKDTSDLESQISAQEKTLAANTKTLEDNAQTIEALEDDVAAAETTILALNSQLSSDAGTTQELNARIDELTGDLKEAQKEIEDRDAVISEQGLKLMEMEPYAENYASIVAELSGHNVGFAANNFSVNRGVIVMSMSDKPKQFYLTANWTEGGTVTMDSLGYAADVNFDNDSWDSGTTMTVNAIEPGITILTFSNNIDTNTFKMLIIVTE